MDSYGHFDLLLVLHAPYSVFALHPLYNHSFLHNTSSIVLIYCISSFVFFSLCTHTNVFVNLFRVRSPASDYPSLTAHNGKVGRLMHLFLANLVIGDCVVHIMLTGEKGEMGVVRNFSCLRGR